MKAYEQKRAYERQINVLHDKISKIHRAAERQQGERALRILGKMGAAFCVCEANAFAVRGSIEIPSGQDDRRVDRALGWTGYHERFTTAIPSRHPKRPHFLSINVDDGHYSFDLCLNRPQAGKLERQLTEEEKNDTFFVRYLSRLCRRYRIRIELSKFERELEEAEKKAATIRTNLARLRKAAN